MQMTKKFICPCVVRLTVTVSKQTTTDSEYCKENRLELNVGKCEIITFTRKRNFISYNYTLNGDTVPRVSLVRDLGVMLDYKLLYTSHFEYIAQKAYKMLGFLFRIVKSFRNIDSLKTLYYAYVRSIMEYASPIWSPSYVTHIAQLESVQRCFIRRLNNRFGARGLDYAERLSFFNILSLENRRLIADMKLLHDIVNAALDCPGLIERIGVSACTNRTRHKRCLYAGSARSNYARQSVLHRIAESYEDMFGDVDIFFVTRSKFISIVIENLPLSR